MAVFEDRIAEIKAEFGNYKNRVAASIADKESQIAEAEKKLQDAAASAVPLDAFVAFCDELLADIKGASS
jgi:hypothetical protein